MPTDGVVSITQGTGTPIRAITGVGPNSADQQVTTPADQNGNFLGISQTSVITSVSVLATTTTPVLSVNLQRRGFSITNDSASVSDIKLALAATASATLYTVYIPVGGYYESPFGWVGAVSAWGVAGTATLSVTEFS